MGIREIIKIRGTGEKRLITGSIKLEERGGTGFSELERIRRSRNQVWRGGHEVQGLIII